MSKTPNKSQSPDSSQGAAMQIARGTQRPGQTREQTKLVAQGIQKGIAQYRMQQNAKARELDRKLKKVNQQLASREAPEIEIREKVTYRQHWLPWVLLVLSWVAMAVFWLAVW